MERDSLSSDSDDDDRRSLVHTTTSALPRPRSAFEISDSPSRLRRHPRCPPTTSLPTLLLSLCLPSLLILILLFAFRRHAPLFPSASDALHMRDSELRALFLLRNQQSLLLRSFNRTFPTAAPAPASSDNNNNPPTVVTVNEFRSAILDQIKLNKQIQNALLSSHRPNNATDLSDTPDPTLINVCQTITRPDQRRAIEWRPRKDRFLFAVCLSGQMSNHLICLEKHMFVAALLDRALVLPSPKFDYDYEQVLDVKNINECFGRKVVYLYSEFAEMRKGKVRVDRFICYVASPPCYLDDDHVKKLKTIGVGVGKIEAAWPEDAGLKTEKKRVAGDVTGKFMSNEEVIAVGDLFYADLEEEWVMQPGGPLAHKCKTVIQPSRLIILTAQRFVQTFLGSNFVALHFRRHGFLKFCNVKKESCFFPVPQAADCISRVVERANAPVVYLSTDAAESETDLLQSLVSLNDKQVPLLKRPSHNSVEKWDALLYRNHLGGDSQVEAMLDKTICAMSNVFIGSSGSTFTDDINRLRRGWGTASGCDEYLCQGEQPNYIADLE